MEIRMGKTTKEFNSVVIFKNQIEALLSLTSLKDVRTILSAIVAYGMNGEDVTVPPQLEFGWIMIKTQIDSVRENYSQRVEKCRDAANGRWNKGMQTDANGCERMRTHANACERMQTDANGCYNKIKIKNKIVPTINVGDNSAQEFTYPKTAEQVICLASQAGNIMEQWDAEMYLADRESKGWKANGQDKAMNSLAQIRADIKKWCLRRDNELREKEAKEKKFEERRKFADGKHLPSVNDYGESDDF